MHRHSRTATAGRTLLGVGAALITVGLFQAASEGPSKRADSQPEAALVSHRLLGTIDGVPVTDGDPILLRFDPADPGSRRRARVDEELLLQEALRLDLPRADPELRRKLIATVIDLGFGDLPEANATEVRAWCARHADLLRGTERRRILHLLVRTQPGKVDAAAAERRAMELRARWLASGEAPESFAAVPGKLVQVFDRAGMRARFPARVTEAAFRQPAGEIGPVIQTPLGAHVLQVREVLAGSERSCAEIAPAARRALGIEKARDRLARHLQRLRDRADIRWAPGAGP